MHRRTFLAGAAAALGSLQAFRAAEPAFASPSTVRDGHPRLLLTGFDPARALVASDPTAAGWYDAVRAAADTMLTRPVAEYVIPDGRRLLATSRETVHRVHTLSMAYAIDGDVAFRDRLWDELAAVCAFPDWNHQRHFLDVAEMTHAVALGYDWWYGEWTDAQRASLEAALVEHGLTRGLDVYEGRVTDHPWHEQENNWNIVCNGGMILGALALADSEPAVAQRVIDVALDSLPIAVASYAPDGGYPEGVGYWGYATRYLVLLMAALETATGGDEGISDLPGLDTTVEFPLHCTGPTGMAFNYYDSGASAPHPAEVFWMAQRYQRPDYGWWAGLGADTRPPSWEQLPLGLLWYRPDGSQEPVEAGTALDAYFRVCEVATARGGWQRAETAFVAGKAGDNQTNHGDLDIGSFVVDALGQRWFTELGSDDYNLPGYFHEPRWTYYRKRAEGQNTIVVDPGMEPDQSVTAAGTIVERDARPAGSWFIADGTATHPALTSWRRGWKLFGHRRHVVIQDEISTDQPSEVWWFAHTAALVAIGEDGRSATLSLGGRELLARIAAPAAATFVQMDARPLWTSPDPNGQNVNRGLRKLAIRLTDVTTTTVAVQLTPLYTGVSVEPLAAVEALSAWTAGPASVATLSALAVDGVPVDGFAPDNFTYGVELREGAEVTATPGDPHSTVRITGGRNGTAVQVVVRRPGRAAGVYRIWPDTPLGLGNFPETIIASSDDGNVPTNTMDGDLGTRWSAEGDGQWIAYDMGADGPIDTVRIAWQSGDIRSAYFDLEVAGDGDTTWRPVFTGSSSGTTTDFEAYRFPATTARYLRLVGHGNTRSGWNSIAELAIDGRTVEVNRRNELESLTLSVPSVPLGGTASASVSGTMTDGSEADLSGVSLSFLALEPAIATVTAEGVIHGVAEGTTAVVAIGETTGRRLLHTRVDIVVADPDRPRVAVVADTYVRDGDYADQNFGDHKGMIVKRAPSDNSGFNRRAFVTFAPDAQPRPVSAVVLGFYAQVADSNGSEIDLVIRRADGAIDELAVTWNTQPLLGDRLGSTHVTSTLDLYRVDLTDALAEPVRRGEPFTLAIVQEPTSGEEGLATRIETRESGSGPYLQLALD